MLSGVREHGAASGDRRPRTLRGIGLAAVAAALSMVLLPGSAAYAARTPPAGTSTAIVAATGVAGSCRAATSGSTVRVKPGDKISLTTSLAGVIRNRLTNTGSGAGTPTGVNISASIDGGRRFDISAARSHTVAGLAAGSHVLRWTVTGVQVTTAHGTTTVPLRTRALQPGAKLSWTGHVLVTSTASRCAGYLDTPRIKLASQDAASPSQLPVLFAILAVIVLVMVAGLYARIYLLHRKPNA